MVSDADGTKEANDEADRLPSPAAHASSGSDECVDVDGNHVSDDGDGGVATPSASVAVGISPAAPDPSYFQLQVGKTSGQMESMVDPFTSQSKSRSSTLSSDPRLPQEVTVSTMPFQAQDGAGVSSRLGDQAAVAPTGQPRVFSYESLEGDTEVARTLTEHGFSMCPSLGRKDTEDSIPLTLRVAKALPHANSPTSSASSSSYNRKSNSSLRRGKWTMEEEAYVARVIQDFNSGFLDAPAGTTLRTYLSEKLQCDPMRITKKFTGDSCIGKRVFHPAVRSPSNAAAIDKAQSELDGLERRWRRRLEMQQRDHAKKAAASAAAAAAATGRPGALLDGHANGPHNPVTQTASWLDRAKSVLKDPSSPMEITGQQEKPENLQSLPRNEIVTQMQEVERLLHEGPIIQQTSAGLPEVVDQASQEAASMTRPDAEPADKRLRTGAEDAEALVGFIRSVRASAESGQDY